MYIYIYICLLHNICIYLLIYLYTYIHMYDVCINTYLYMRNAILLHSFTLIFKFHYNFAYLYCFYGSILCRKTTQLFSL